MRETAIDSEHWHDIDCLHSIFNNVSFHFLLSHHVCIIISAIAMIVREPSSISRAVARRISSSMVWIRPGVCELHLIKTRIISFEVYIYIYIYERKIVNYVL